MKPIELVEVIMLKTSFGSEDGRFTRRYAKGEVYHLPEHLAMSFINAKHATLHVDIPPRLDCNSPIPKMQQEPQNKAVTQYKNKNRG